MGFSKDLKATQNVKTLQGDDVLVRSSSAGVTINGNSKVIAADIAATNGVVHIIDTVLMPPAPAKATTAVSGPSKNIVELALGSSDLSTLVTALKRATWLLRCRARAPSPFSPRPMRRLPSSPRQHSRVCWSPKTRASWLTF